MPSQTIKTYKLIFCYILNNIFILFLILILSNVCDIVVKQINWGKEMLVSSFGYLNKNISMANGVRTDNVKDQKLVVNKGLAFDMAVEDKPSVCKTNKAEGFIAKCLNIIA